MSERDVQSQGSSLPGLGIDFKLSAHPPGTLSHTGQTCAGRALSGIEARSIIGEPQVEPITRNLEIDVYFGASRVARHVVDTLLEDQKDFPALLCHQAALPGSANAKPEFDTPAGQEISRES